MFSGDYLREHINFGYAVTVHSAQGVTADTGHAALGENATRNLLYVAMTRGRHTNTAYLYERIDDRQEQSDAALTLVRGTPMEAVRLVHTLIAHDSSSGTAHHLASQADAAAVPDRVTRFVRRRADAYASRRDGFDAWQAVRTQESQVREGNRIRGGSLSRDSRGLLHG